MSTMAFRVKTQHLFLCFLFIVHYIGHITGIFIRELQVPSEAIQGDTIHLGCNYETETGSRLYTLKWYKDDQEFYRHQPGISPHSLTDRCKDHHIYAVQGVNVDCWVSTEREVVLTQATTLTSGEYQCEVIGEHPTFTKQIEKARLTVFAEPLLSPLILGAEDSYSLSEKVALNCTSANHEYVPTLSWSINGEPAHQNYVHHYGHQTLGLLFRAQEGHFRNGVINVSCSSTIGNYHKKSTERKLRSRNFLTAEEYQYNAGEQTGASGPLTAIFVSTACTMLGIITGYV